jgi:hypothetical protein
MKGVQYRDRRIDERIILKRIIGMDKLRRWKFKEMSQGKVE